MKLQEVIENVLADFYTKHEQGEQLLIQDLQDLVDEGYLVPADKSPYGILSTDYVQLAEKYSDLTKEHNEQYDELKHIEALLQKFETRK